MAKNYSWDNKAVESAVGRVRAEAFRLTAVGIRRTAMRSMKKGTKRQYVSKPGEAPRRHSSALQKSIYFALDQKKMSAVIGPVKFKGQSQGAAALEKGGYVSKYVSTVLRTASGRIKRSANTYYRPMNTRSEGQQRHIREYYKSLESVPPQKVKMRIQIRARPFMVPAMKQEIKNMKLHIARAVKKFKK